MQKKPELNTLKKPELNTLRPTKISAILKHHPTDGPIKHNKDLKDQIHASIGPLGVV